MPGSLFLGNDNYSDVSDASGRSVDSKTGGKKVSFNKAVRVKQYPWKPDFEVSASEHLTLPSNRFWFKVYKNKQEPPSTYDYNQMISKPNAWEEESMECIHDSLAPIAEVEDQEIDPSPRQPNKLVERNGYSLYSNKGNKVINNGTHGYNYQPTDPPVDYYDETNSTPIRNTNGVKQVWGAVDLNNGEYSMNNSFSNGHNQRSPMESRYQFQTIKENDAEYNIDVNNTNTRFKQNGFNNEFSTRRSLRRQDTSDPSISRERRSRSYDDYMENDNGFKHLRKADKSVSTEDLNSESDRFSPANRFYKGSRDIATQCYGTLTRNKNTSMLPNLNSSSTTQTDSFVNTSERLKNFKTPKSRLNMSDDYNNNNSSPKKDYSLEKFSNLSRPRVNITRPSNITQPAQNQKQLQSEALPNNKIANGHVKPLRRTENSISSIIQKQANKSFSKLNYRNEINSSPTILSRKSEENTIQGSNQKQPSTVGYLRGRQIPLSEVNTNTNRKFLSRNNIGLNQSGSRNMSENHLFSSQSIKSDFDATKRNQSKRFLSPTNNPERRSFRINSNSAKNYSSAFSEGGRSVIDWSLSGFQLAPKPDNPITSMSDSEYTVHRRPPLLMYIPGVSHHDRPAIEDDRLSALSVGSDINDGLSSLGGSRLFNDRNGLGDFQRRQSMREEKSKWMKWRSKS